MASFSGNPARHAHIVPPDSIWRRPSLDVPADPNNAAIMALCEAAWEKPWVTSSGYGLDDHNDAAANPTDSNRRQPGYYVNEQFPTQGTRTVSLNQAGDSNLTANPSATSVTARVEGLGDVRVEGGHAGAHHIFTPTPFVMPAGPMNDNHYVAENPVHRTHIHTISYGLIPFAFTDVKADSVTQHSYDSNDVPYNARGRVAGSNGGRVPPATLLIRGDEVDFGWIDHYSMGVAYTYPNHPNAALTDAEVGGDGHFLWPAQATDGEQDFLPPPPGGGSTYFGPFAGHVLRLKMDFDMSGFSAKEQVILRSWQHFGIVLMDKHGPRAAVPDVPHKPIGVAMANHPSLAGVDFDDEELPLSAFEWVDLSALVNGNPTLTWAAHQPGS